MSEHTPQRNPDRLSPDGVERRESMLTDLVGEMQHLHRRRRAYRVTLSTTAIGLLMISTIRFAMLPKSLDSVTSVPQQPHVVELAQGRVIDLQWVTTDPGVMERYGGEPTPIIVQITDSELIETLAQVGRPAGLIQFGERIRLSVAVTDDELRANPHRF